MISIHEFKTSKLKRYYGASRRVYRQHHVDELLQVWKDLNYLCECKTRTILVPMSPELFKKSTRIYNDVRIRLQNKYPNIKEFHIYN